MFALVDCNNFYVSCERIFRPDLEGKPVIVLSNNDGCIISRSEEAKKLGLKMAEPAFYKKKFLKDHNVYSFSSNYTLYGDMSQRVMDTLRLFSPEVEVYSIDEAFLNISGIKNLQSFIDKICKTVLKYTGIPVSIGVGTTKSLAKVANKIAKKNKEYKGSYIINNDQQRDCILRNTHVENLWGIGRQYHKLLRKNNIITAYDYTQTNNQWIKKKMSVVGVRIKQELQGISCIPLELVIPDKKAIATTRAFGKKLTDYSYIREAVATYATRCSEKLRKQSSIANMITVFIHTDPFNPHEKQYNQSKTLTLPVPTSSSYELVHYAIIGLSKIYRKEYRYKKAGVIVEGLMPEKDIQGNMFYNKDISTYNQLAKTTDTINRFYGKDTVKLAVMGSGSEWKLRQKKLSGRSTTCWKEIIKIIC